jgi:hypothetical protein
MKQTRQMILFFILLSIGSTFEISQFPPRNNNNKGNKKPTTPKTTGNKTAKDENTAKNPEINTNQQTLSIFDKQTKFKEYETYTIVSLNYHNIDCGENSAINAFKLETSPSNQTLRFKYTCVKSTSIKNTCTLMYSKEAKAFNQIYYISNLYVECPNGKVLQKFEFYESRNLVLPNLSPTYSYNKREGKKTFKYKNNAYLPASPIMIRYRCCDADIDRTINFETAKTTIPNSGYLNLDKAELKAMDFNVLQNFHLKSPLGLIYYSATANVLKGQTSPSFPEISKGKSRKSETEGKSKVYLPSRIVYLDR